MLLSQICLSCFGGIWCSRFLFQEYLGWSFPFSHFCCDWILCCGLYHSCWCEEVYLIWLLIYLASCTDILPYNRGCVAYVFLSNVTCTDFNLEKGKLLYDRIFQSQSWWGNRNKILRFFYQCPCGWFKVSLFRVSLSIKYTWNIRRKTHQQIQHQKLGRH